MLSYGRKLSGMWKKEGLDKRALLSKFWLETGNSKICQNMWCPKFYISNNTLYFPVQSSKVIEEEWKESRINE